MVIEKPLVILYNVRDKTQITRFELCVLKKNGFVSRFRGSYYSTARGVIDINAIL